MPPARENADGFHFLSHLELMFNLLVLRLGTLALGDVTDVALDHFGLADAIHVTDEFNVDEAPVMGLKRQVLVADIFLLLQLPEGVP